jgi:hypothetical protein
MQEQVVRKFNAQLLEICSIKKTHRNCAIVLNFIIFQISRCMCILFRYWVCVVPQAILIFVSWMLPLNDCELDAQRKATLDDGIMCWLPVGTFFELSSNAFYLGFWGWKSSLGSEM